jgi:uncharacterized protein (TIGR02231 family)
MKERDSLIILCLFFFLLCPSPARAVPKEVMLFPDGARVTDVAKVRLLPEGKDRSRGIIIIPAQADPASLVVYPSREPRIRIEDMRWRNRKTDEDAKTQEFQKRAKALKYEKNRLEASRQALDAQIQFWQQQIKAKVKTSAEAGTLSSVIGKNIKTAFQERLNLLPEISECEKKIKALDEEFKLWEVSNKSKWEVTMLFSGNPAGEALITYSYNLTGCGWSPLYRLDAHPQKGEIQFIMEADIWQNSAENWNDVDITLSNSKPPSSLAPTELLSRIIKSRQEIQLKGKGTTGKTKSASQPPAQGMDKSNDAAADAGWNSFITWKAGKKTITLGSHQMIMIHEEIVPAAFTYLARPSKGPQAFIHASLHLPAVMEVMEVARGNVLFLLEGAMMGKKDLVSTGQDENIFFGIDPSVTATAAIVKQETNNSGDKKIYRRQWRINMENHHTFPIRMRIEEPMTASSDERIKISLDHSPAPSEQKSATLIWNFDLAAGENKELLIGWEIEAPANVEIDPEWG